ncbi:uncharacterized protein LOC115452094 [Manduca sexta]|uniref:uncharacterized protein LOC115452094 n=1 Tax=Manduca sexta TaxID=7130 RepID=UPI00188EB9C2|nr:uncharacterized protein LOC115452094 [Manduca sexta]
MSSLQFGVLSSFDHTMQSWKSYKGRIAQWYIANDITETSDATGTKRRAILLSALSDGTFKLASDLALPKELQDVPFEDILQLLDKHFTPKRCGFGERCNFYAASQHADETPTQWAARLRGLTAHCGFSNVEETLRDRFVMGMLPGHERNKLFAQDLAELTLAKAIEVAETIRSARMVAAATAHLAGQPEQLYKINQKAASKTISVDKCLVCGRSNHTSSKCRFAKYKCKKCNVQGHLQRMCNKVNYIVTDEVDEGDDVFTG